MAETRAILSAAAEETLAAFQALRAADAEESDIGAILRAPRHVPAAMEVLFTLSNLKAVSQFFLDPAMRQDGALLAGLSPAERRADTGIAQVGNEAGERGGDLLGLGADGRGDGAGEIVLALEVIVEGALRHVRRRHDLIDRDGIDAVPREQPFAGRQQRRAGFPAAAIERGRVATLTISSLLDDLVINASETILGGRLGRSPCDAGDGPAGANWLDSRRNSRQMPLKAADAPGEVRRSR